MNVTTVNLPDRDGQNIIKDLFNGAWCRGARIGGTGMPPLSLLYAATAARAAGINGRFVDAVREGLAGEALVHRLRGTDVLLAHTSNYTLAHDEALLRMLRLSLGCRVALFGNLEAPTANRLVDAGVADWVCRQDPEEAFAELAQALAASGRPAGPIAALHAAGVATPPPHPPGPLDDKPVPDRTPIRSFCYRNPLSVTRDWTTALTSRGCPFACGFCNTPGYYGRTYRRHSSAYVVEELRYLRALGYAEVFFRDDLFFAGKVGELCEAMIRADLRLVWSCNHRVDTLDEPTLRLMHRAGCHTIKFGVESGDDTVLASLGKPVHVRAEQAFEQCRRIGIRTHAHLMIGLPGETRTQMEQTVRLLHRLSPYSFTMGMFTPHPGSAFHNRLSADGFTVGGDWKDRVRGNPSAVSDDELDALLRRTYLSFYLAPRRVFRYARDVRKWAQFASAGLRMARGFLAGGRR